MIYPEIAKISGPVLLPHCIPQSQHHLQKLSFLTSRKARSKKFHEFSSEGTRAGSHRSGTEFGIYIDGNESRSRASVDELGPCAYWIRIVPNDLQWDSKVSNRVRQPAGSSGGTGKPP